MIRHSSAISLCVAIAGLTAWSLAAPAAAADRPSPTQMYSAAALYDLGNSYARSGKSALAVLNYERARVLAPRDSDIQTNLRKVREAAGLPARSGTWLADHGRFASPNAMYWLGITGVLLAGGAFLFRRPRSTHRAALAALTVAGLGMMALTLLDAAATASALDASVAMQAVPATASPVSGAEPLFTVPAAAAVRVLDEHRGFLLIRDSQGRDGWVAGADLARVIPRPPTTGAPAT